MDCPDAVQYAVVMPQMLPRVEWRGHKQTAMIRYCAAVGLTKPQTVRMMERLTGRRPDDGTLGVQYSKGHKGLNVPCLSSDDQVKFNKLRPIAEKDPARTFPLSTSADGRGGPGPAMAEAAATKKEEQRWVAQLEERLLHEPKVTDEGLRVRTGQRLPYHNEIYAFEENSCVPGSGSIAKPDYFATDLLIYDELNRGWVPRLVVECKRGKEKGKKTGGDATTHAALLYGCKSVLHRHVLPYLRYGTLWANFDSVPQYLRRHGKEFDFVAVWTKTLPNDWEWAGFVDLVVEEVRASRELWKLLRRDDGARTKIKLIHHRLELGDWAGSA